MLIYYRMSEVSKEKIIEYIETWTAENLGSSFVFRPFQKETVYNLIANVLGTTKVQVLEAPTGSGKSYIAMITAGVLKEYFDKTSYILVSDTSLFKQYENDVKKHSLKWGCICGKDNYICSRNGEPFSASVCQSKDVSMATLIDYQTASEKGYSCATKCKYIQAYKKARESDIVVMTYQLWLISSCLMKYQGQPPLYPAKDIIICDEAHKIPEIVQGSFSPKVNMDDYSFLHKIDNFMEDEEVQDVPTWTNINQTVQVMKLIYNKEYSDIYDKRKDLLLLLERLYSQFERIQNFGNTVRTEAKNSKEVGRYYKVLKALTSVGEVYSCMKLYLTIIRSKGFVNFIPSMPNEDTIVFNCANESELIKETIHKEANQEILMSATIGDADIFMELIGASEFSKSAMEVSSIFDFSKSPIYMGSNYKMSYNEKATSLPHIVKQIEQLCEKHRNGRGIIHSGTYEISKAIYNSLPPNDKARIIFYNNAKGREEAIRLFKQFPNKILMGPSILEGLDFEGDLCRFIIIAKLPYASLGDNLVKAKMEMFPRWYSYDCVNKITQGIGRGVRSETDFCSTYILDGCFANLVAREGNLFSKNISSRFRRLTI